LIYPTPRAAVLAALGGPAALIAGSVNEGLWVIGLFWCAGVIFVCVLDALLGAAIKSANIAAPAFPFFSIARHEDWRLACDFGGRTAPSTLQAAIDCDSRLGVADIQAKGVRDKTETGANRALFDFAFSPLRRGRGMIRAATVRWLGPLGLVWKQKRFDFNHDAPITTNIRGVREEALRWFARNAMFGSKVDRTLGEGSEFHALREFQTGMDRRSLDWKQSARHGKLLAKEYRTERNHNIIFAMDCGRIMCEPVGGAPRIDRAIEAALLTALACLRAGDRAGVFAFDARPRTSSGALSGSSAFATLQHSVSEIDYSTEETNYVLGLATLSGELKRRSLVIVFTEFADQTAAQLMVEALGRLLKRHLVMFVAFRDEELEALQDVVPIIPEDVSRAVVAATLLSERDLVLARLKAMGVHIVEGSAGTIGPNIISAYLDLKARDLL
jgi:uncharacterized protein (DUF58 family)